MDMRARPSNSLLRIRRLGVRLSPGALIDHLVEQGISNQTESIRSSELGADSRLDSQLEDTDIPMDGQTRLWHSTPAPPVDRLDPADGPIRIRQRGAVPGAVRNCGRQRERGRGGRAAAMMALCGTDRSRRDGGPMLFPTVAGDEICGGTPPVPRCPFRRPTCTG